MAKTVEDEEEQLSTGEDPVEEEVSEAFLAGWRAKQRTANQRKARGFHTQKTGNGSVTGASRLRDSAPNTAKTMDQRKATTKLPLADFAHVQV